MATLLKQSTAVDVAAGPFVDSADGFTPMTALTITQPDIRLKKNGGAWAQKSAAQTLSHEENGWYEVALSATDTDTLGILMMAIYESGAMPVWREFMVVPANVYNSLVLGTASLFTEVLTNQDKTGYQLADDAITAAKFDETTAFPLIAADTGLTEVARTGADGDTLETLSDEIAGVGSAPSAATNAAAVWNEPRADHLALGTFGQSLQGVVRSATAQTGAAGTITLDASASASNDAYNGFYIAIIKGTGMGQIREIDDYVGATKVATISPNWDTIPDVTSVFAIFS